VYSSRLALCVFASCAICVFVSSGVCHLHMCACDMALCVPTTRLSRVVAVPSLLPHFASTPRYLPVPTLLALFAAPSSPFDANGSQCTNLCTHSHSSRCTSSPCRAIRLLSSPWVCWPPHREIVCLLASSAGPSRSVSLSVGSVWPRMTECRRVRSCRLSAAGADGSPGVCSPPSLRIDDEARFVRALGVDREENPNKQARQLGSGHGREQEPAVLAHTRVICRHHTHILI
jgi:hypothetical protein